MKIEFDERTGQLMRVVSPFLVFVSPAVLIGLAYVLARDTQNGDDIGSPLSYVPMIIGLVAGFLGGLWYCRNYMGWFQRDDSQ